MNNEHEACGRCGRKLKTAKSIAEGYGPVCKRKVEIEKALSEQENYQDGEAKNNG